MVKPIFTEEDIEADPVVVIDERKFFKTTITVEVISEGAPMDCVTDLRDLHAAIVDGPCSGDIKITAVKELTPGKAAAGLIRQGSEPEFFGLEDCDQEARDLIEWQKKHKFARIVFEREISADLGLDAAANILQNEVEDTIQDHGILPDDVEMHDTPYKEGTNENSVGEGKA
ncbi:MAG: hypothetical protein WA130_04190 [Candidatus Methanoperedens sp.]